MNRRTLNVVLLSAALAGTMVSCQKDEIVLSHETDSEVERISSLDISQKSLAYEVVTITYWRNGMRYKKGFSSYEDLNYFKESNCSVDEVVETTASVTAITPQTKTSEMDHIEYPINFMSAYPSVYETNLTIDCVSYYKSNNQ